jgi:hypothetical protein
MTILILSFCFVSCRDSPDVITVFDGLDNTAAVIGQFCGIHNAEEVISTGTALYVAFTSDERNQKQGNVFKLLEEIKY